MIATATIIVDRQADVTLSDWLLIFRRYAIGSMPWPVVTVLIFLWVRRFLSPDRSTLRYAMKTGLFTASMALVYIWLAGVLFAFNFDIPVTDFAWSIRAIPAFSWFWDATLLVVIMGLAHAWAYSQRYTAESARAEASKLDNERLEAELTRLELELLRAQLEPHFLFNSLNSISALIRSSSTDDATDALASLSELLRYAIESGRLESVTVSKEVNVAEEYLRLQKLRFGERIQTDIRISAAATDCRVPPMLLQPMLENAVQYSMGDASKEATISVSIDYEDNSLSISIENSARSGIPEKSGFGLGLTNVQRRLRCLFPGSHTFDARHVNGSFVARVTLSYEDAGASIG